MICWVGKGWGEGVDRQTDKQIFSQKNGEEEERYIDRKV